MSHYPDPTTGTCRMCGAAAGATSDYPDWRDAVDAFRTMFADIVTNRPNGLPGANMMTPDRLGNVLVAGEIIEISTGFGPCGDRIYGVTYPTRPADDRSSSYHTLADVRAAVTS
jgi:hypothetical protein